MCEESNKKIDWTKPLQFHNNEQFVIEVLGNSLSHSNLGTAVKMYHPKRPYAVFYSIFDTNTGRCMEVGRDSNEFDRISNREVYEWCVSYKYNGCCYVTKYNTENRACIGRTNMATDPAFSDVSPVWKQIKK